MQTKNRESGDKSKNLDIPANFGEYYEKYRKDSGQFNKS